MCGACEEGRGGGVGRPCSPLSPGLLWTSDLQGTCHPLSAGAKALAVLGPCPHPLGPLPGPSRKRPSTTVPSGMGVWTQYLGVGGLPTCLGSPHHSPSPDTLLSQQPSEDLVPYDTDLYQRQTHEYYPYLSSDGESHSGECRAHPAPLPQPGPGLSGSWGLEGGKRRNGSQGCFGMPRARRGSSCFPGGVNSLP